MTTKGPYATMAAAGTTQATAAEFTADKVMVTSITEGSADGVILPPGNLDNVVKVINGTANDSLLIYPRSGGKINNQSADSPLTLPARHAVRFEGVNSIDWVAFY